MVGVGIVWQTVAGKLRAEANAEHECSRSDDASGQESATADILNSAHAISPAAALIAVRIRWYVPQRQMFPDMDSSISWSVGFFLLFNSAAACMICPTWQ